MISAVQLARDVRSIDGTNTHREIDKLSILTSNYVYLVKLRPGIALDLVGRGPIGRSTYFDPGPFVN